MQGTQLPLRDIQLPPEPSWWPPALGWWLLAAGVLTVLVLLVWFWRRWRARRVWQKSLAGECHALGQAYRQHGDALALARECSALLRRAAMARFPREDVAGLEGTAWLAFLDRPLKDQPFEHGIGRCLADVAWRPQTIEDPDGLLRLTERWLLTTLRARP